jgi:hypothetical protein
MKGFLCSLSSDFCRVHFVISHSSIPSFTPHRHRTQELPSFVRSVSFAHSTYRCICFFNPAYLRLQHRSALRNDASPPHTKAPNRFIRFISLHCLISSSTCLSQRTRSITKTLPDFLK